MTFGQQNTEKEAHELLSYAFDRGINILDTAEAVSIELIRFLMLLNLKLVYLILDLH